MKLLKGKRAFITGASSGIGEACCEYFAKEGANLIIVARREDRLKNLAERLEKEYGVEVTWFKLDVGDRKDVETKLSSMCDEAKKIDILINNAGGAHGLEKLQDGNIDDWEKMINSNLTGLLYVSKLVIGYMLNSNIKGHIVNIGSIAGIAAYPNGAVYCAVKSAVRTLTDGMRIDLVDTDIKVTNIQPGLVETEFSLVRFKGDEKRAKNVYAGKDPLISEDIADMCLYAVTRPARMLIAEMTVYPKSQASALIYRKQNS